MKFLIQKKFFRLRLLNKFAKTLNLTGRIVKVHVPYITTTIFLRLGTSDVSVFGDIFIRGEYNALQSLSKSHKIIIDGGANIGLFAILMKNKYPNAKIVCVEPDAENFAMLRKNLKFYDDIFYENCGLWSRDTMLKVYDKYNLGKWGLIVEETLIGGTVPALSMDSLLKKHAIKCVDVLKLDIEGSEKNLFSSDISSWISVVKTIVIELHDRMESSCSKSFFSAINAAFSNYSLSISGENIIISEVELA